MKNNTFSFFAAVLCRGFAAFVLLTGMALPLQAASLSLSPSTIANDYVGPLDFTITGLDSAGQTVIIEEFLDADGSATITAGDVLLGKFSVTDGQVTSIGGQRALSVPGDEDGIADSQIHTRLLYSANGGLGHIDGLHMFRVSPSGSGFASVTTNFVVTQKDYGGSGISGTVVGGSPLSGKPGSIILLQKAGPDGSTVAITFAGAGGNYSIKVPPGSYQIIAGKSGFVYNYTGAPVLAVTTGSFLANQTATLVTGQRTISGQVRNATSLAGVAGQAVFGQSQAGYVSVTVTPASGNFVMDATTDPWQAELEGTTVARLGLVGVRPTESSAISVTGFNIDLPQATALIYGTLKTPAAVPLVFADIEGSTDASPRYRSKTVTDANGNYALNAINASWNWGPPDLIPGYIIADKSVIVSDSDVLGNLIAYPVTAHLIGTIKDKNGSAIGNLSLSANTPDPANPNGSNLNVNATADGNGNFDLGVFGGTVGSPVVWNLNLQNPDSGPSPYVSSNPSYNVVDGVNQTNLTFTLYAASAHLKGTVRDKNGSAVGNLSISASTSNPANPNGSNLSVNATADGSGSFDLWVFGGTVGSPAVWNLGLQNNGSGLATYISSNPSYSVVDGVDQNGLTFTVYPVTAHLTGRLLDENNAPIGNTGINAWLGTSGNVFSDANVDGAGNFDIPVYGGTWNLGMWNFDSLNVIPQNFALTVVDGVSQGNLIFKANHRTAVISGTVKGPGGVPISGVGVFGRVTTGGNDYWSPSYTQIYTDNSGTYSFPAFVSATAWKITVDPNGLGSQGFQFVPEQSIVVGGNPNYTVDFVASLLTTYVVTPSAGANGGISPNTPQSVGSGNFVIFTAAPNAGYVVNQWSVDGSVAQAGGGQFTMSTVVASHTVSVTFKTGTVQTYALNPFTDGNGFISPNIAPVVSSGGNATFTATPNGGYVVNQWTVDGNVAQIGGASFTISNVTDNHQVGVSFRSTGQGTPQSWRQTWYNTTANSGDAADNSDPYHRGMTNLMAFAFFGPNQNPALAQISQLPQIQKTATTLSCSFNQPSGVSGIIYGAESTVSLSNPNWQPVTDTVSGSLHTFTVPVGTNTRLFLRLTVTEQ